MKEVGARGLADSVLFTKVVPPRCISKKKVCEGGRGVKKFLWHLCSAFRFGIRTTLEQPHVWGHVDPRTTPPGQIVSDREGGRARSAGTSGTSGGQGGQMPGSWLRHLCRQTTEENTSY